MTATVVVDIEGLRDSRGIVRLCLTDRSEQFPRCYRGQAITAEIDAVEGDVRHVFRDVPHGTYAISAFHDANRNGKMDRLMGMPKEGFAFSRNPPLRPRAPTFGETQFTVGGNARERIRMRYLL